MGAEAFLDDVLKRVKEFLNVSQETDIIRNGLPHGSLRRTIDLKLPMEGHGIQSVSYTHLRAHETLRLSRMPSSA